MKIIRGILIFTVITISTVLFAAEHTTLFNVKGMGWPGRAYKVSSALKKVAGVKQVTTDYKKHTVKIIFNDDKVNSEKLKKTIEKAGFQVVK